MAFVSVARFTQEKYCVQNLCTFISSVVRNAYLESTCILVKPTTTRITMPAPRKHIHLLWLHKKLMHFWLNEWGAGGVGPNWSEEAENQLIMHEMRRNGMSNAFSVCWILAKVIWFRKRNRPIPTWTWILFLTRFDSIAVVGVVAVNTAGLISCWRCVFFRC